MRRFVVPESMVLQNRSFIFFTIMSPQDPSGVHHENQFQALSHSLHYRGLYLSLSCISSTTTAAFPPYLLLSMAPFPENRTVPPAQGWMRCSFGAWLVAQQGFSPITNFRVMSLYISPLAVIRSAPFARLPSQL